MSDPTPHDDDRRDAEPYQAATKTSPWVWVFCAGILLLLSGLLWWWVEDTSDWLTRGWLFVGLVLTLAPVFWHAVDIYAAVFSRRGAASGFVLLSLVLAVVGYGIVGWLNIERGDTWWKADTTKGGRYTLDDESQKLLAQIEGTLFLTYVQQASTDPGLRAEAIDQVRVYGDAGPKVKVETLNGIRDPARTKAYLGSVGVAGTTSGETDDLLVISYAEPGREPVPGKHKEVRIEPYSMYKSSPTGETKWLGERVISDAITELVFRRYTAYATGGHGERALAEELRAVRDGLRAQNVEVVAAPLELAATRSVPDDCDLLLILDPQTPFSPEEQSALESYLARGRALFLSVDVARQRRELGLEKLLDGYGLYARPNYVVIAPFLKATGMTNVYTPLPLLVVRPQDYSQHAAVAALRARAGLATVFNESTFIEIEERPKAGVQVEGLVYAPYVEGVDPPGFCARVDETRVDFQTPNRDTDKVGGRPAIAACASRAIASAPGTAQASSRVVLFGDTDVLTDQMIQRAPANRDLAMGALLWAIRREGLVAVSARTLETDTVKLSPHAARLAQAWPLGVAILSLFVGLLIWWLRRR